MKIKLRYLFMFLGLFIVFFSFNNTYVNASSPVQELAVSVKTNKLVFDTSDKIEIEITVTNTLSQEKTIHFSSGCQTSYIIGYYDHTQELKCTMALTSVTLPPYGSHTWKMTHDLKNNTIPAGSYYVVGKLLGNNLPSATSQNMITIASMVNNPDCLPGHFYSFITGEQCFNPPIISTQGPVLKLGSKGQEVKVLQEFLGINADGIFGPITRQKVMEWQLMKNLSPDGAFGPASRLRANTN
jgi:hypothetical protein